MKNIIRVAALALILLPAMAQAQQGKYFTDNNNVAIKGYDVVNYFTTYSAKQGSEKYTAKHDGVTYYFVSSENQKLFKANPEKYMPAYGGYCAFGVAQGAKYPVDPETFKIYNGKLLLFFNDIHQGKKVNTIIPWNGDEANMAAAADEKWTGLND